MSTKHKNYQILNLIGYGLAKFDTEFIKNFGFSTKTAFYKYLIQLNVAETTGVIKNRQDLFDPYFENDRVGWAKNADRYIHRKLLIDNLFGEEKVDGYANIVKLFLQSKFNAQDLKVQDKPIYASKYRQMQETGLEAELFFMKNYHNIDIFNGGILEDARLFGDGYDFQIETNKYLYLIDVKGVREKKGSIRLTEKEYLKAKEYKNLYTVVVVNNLNMNPKFNLVIDPITNLKLTPKTIISKPSINYHSEVIKW